MISDNLHLICPLLFVCLTFILKLFALQCAVSVMQQSDNFVLCVLQVESYKGTVKEMVSGMFINVHFVLLK